jgi:hypothetical protein
MPAVVAPVSIPAPQAPAPLTQVVNAFTSPGGTQALTTAPVQLSIPVGKALAKGTVGRSEDDRCQAHGSYKSGAGVCAKCAAGVPVSKAYARRMGLPIGTVLAQGQATAPAPVQLAPAPAPAVLATAQTSGLDFYPAGPVTSWTQASLAQHWGQLAATAEGKAVLVAGLPDLVAALTSATQARDAVLTARLTTQVQTVRHLAGLI